MVRPPIIFVWELGNTDAVWDRVYFCLFRLRAAPALAIIIGCYDLLRDAKVQCITTSKQCTHDFGKRRSTWQIALQMGQWVAADGQPTPRIWQ